jgi:hypothetical protein
MNTRKMFVTLGLFLALAIILPVARADEFNQAIKFTFNKRIQVPGHDLPAGTYWFVLADAHTSRDIVQIFSADRSTLYATVSTVNIESLTPTDTTTITFADREPMQPETILSWFYPGRTSGHQFVYSNIEARELAQVKHHTVMAKAENKHQALMAGD